MSYEAAQVLSDAELEASRFQKAQYASEIEGVPIDFESVHREIGWTV